jgi:glucose/mannose-6-phosphate isomerase
VRRDDVLAYPEQIGDALWRVEAAGVPHGPVDVCGVAYGAGELAVQIVGGRGLSGGERIAMCASYSGDDEEALACFEQAGRRVAVCTAGRLAARAREESVPVVGVPAGLTDPRAAIVYFTVAAVMCAAPQLKPELEAAAATIARLAAGEEPELRTPSDRVLGQRFQSDLAEAGTE